MSSLERTRSATTLRLTVGAIAVAALLAGGAVTGVVLASPAPSGSQQTADEQVVQSAPLPTKQEVVFPRNAKGMTYGSELDAVTPDQAPDLIEAYANNGTVGYVLRTDLHPAGPASPEEALAHQDKRGSKSSDIPVYDLEFQKVVGVFTIDATTPS